MSLTAERRSAVAGAAGVTTPSVLRAASFLNPLVDGCFFEAQIATKLEMGDLALLDKPVNGAQVAVQVISNHPGGQDLVVTVAAIFPIPIFHQLRG
jgi:hypothetical protein